MENKTVVYIASDHAGYHKKQFICRLLSKQGFNFQDLGPENTHSVDYPEYAYGLAQKIQENPEARGILLCGSGIGMSMAANRFPHIRAALCYTLASTLLARAHNDANVLVLGARSIKKCQARKFVQVFLTTSFLGNRHLARVHKLTVPTFPPTSA